VTTITSRATETRETKTMFLRNHIHLNLRKSLRKE